MIVRYSVISYALLMRLIIGFILLASMGFVVAETVYKTVDEDGNTIFTDKPSKNAEEIKLQKLQTIKNPNPSKYTPKPKQTEQEALYKTLLVSNPADGAGLRSNNGNVSISLSLQPPLRLGHKIIIRVDGQEVSNGSESSVSFQNMDRGTHSITASVVDGNGKQMISTSSSFSLLRASQ
ncbi:MAG: hypothetical protein DHS20C09_08380 [marine bacterium B5-7]|nr:MAG: hypothetical protein DHS20C09_08380 [marine bacterium B5-7]